MNHQTRTGPRPNSTAASTTNRLVPAGLSIDWHSAPATDQLRLSPPGSSPRPSSHTHCAVPLFGITTHENIETSRPVSSPQQIPNSLLQGTNSSFGINHNSPIASLVPTDSSTIPSLLSSSSSSSAASSLLFGTPPVGTTFESNLININMSSSSSPSSQSFPRVLTNRSRSRSRDNGSSTWSPPASPGMRRSFGRNHDRIASNLINSNSAAASISTNTSALLASSTADAVPENLTNNSLLQLQKNNTDKLFRGLDDTDKTMTEKLHNEAMICHQLSMDARKENDSMIYLDGPRIYTCGECRTHLTSHDEIISKSFHGRHGRAYLFDQCVNVNIGPAEDRRLITGLHSVCDIFCKRCKTLIGWTYEKAYESSQKYKEGKFIIEKINLHMEESDYYEVSHPAGERRDRWKMRSMSWSECNLRDRRSQSFSHHSPSRHQDEDSVVYEYRPQTRTESTGPGVSPFGSHARRTQSS